MSAQVADTLDRYCEVCALTKLAKPSDCLREFLKQSDNGDWLGPMLGPVGAVIYVRQSYHKIETSLAWSGTEAMLDALEGFKPKRYWAITPYIRRFARRGL